MMNMNNELFYHKGHKVCNLAPFMNKNNYETNNLQIQDHLIRPPVARKRSCNQGFPFFRC